jgi:hypothetical protein
MTQIQITISEANLSNNNKLRKILAECQKEGVVNMIKVETSNYTLKPPSRKIYEPKGTPPPEVFVAAVKFVVNHAALQNGKLIKTIDRGIPGGYCFWLDATAWCETMDKLLKNHRNVIEATLEHKQRADGVNLLATFVGAIIDERIFQGSGKIRKTELLESFRAYYGEPKASVKTRLSTPNRSWYEFNKMVDVTCKIAKGSIE